MNDIKPAVDHLSGLAIATKLFDVFPGFITTLGALLAAVWYAVRLYEYFKEKHDNRKKGK